MNYIEKIKKNIVVAGNGCWLWLGYADTTSGYGTMSYKGKGKGIHVVSYTVFNGEVEKGMCVCHKCDVRLCCNPDHLFKGTTRDNFDDLMTKGRKINDGTANKWKIDLAKAINTVEDPIIKAALTRKFGVP